MSGDEISELVVAARPEGLEETSDGLEQIEQRFDETAESFDETTAEFEDLQSRWQGAMTAIVTGLSVAVGGLLSTVPVLGEVMGGLGSILEAIGFQIDQVLRPALMPLTKRLFDVSAAIFQLDGRVADLFGLWSLFTTAIFGAGTALLGFIGYTQGLGAAFGAVTGAISGAIGAVKSMVTIVGQAVTTIVSGSTALAVGLGAAIGTLGVFALEISGVLDAVKNFGKWIGNKLPGSVRDGFLALIFAVTGPLSIIGAAIVGFVKGYLKGGLSEGIDGMVSSAKSALGVFEGVWRRAHNAVKDLIGGFIDAFRNMGESARDEFNDLNVIQWGEDLVNGIITGIESKLDALRSAANSVAEVIRDRMPGSPAETGPLSDLDESGPGLVQTLSRGMTANIGQAQSAASEVAAGADPSGFGAQRSRAPSIILDGREVSRGTSRYRDDGISRQGRFE
jgi:hypothetical protein